MTQFKQISRFFIQMSLSVFAVVSLEGCMQHQGSLSDHGLNGEQLLRAHWMHSKALLGSTEIKSFDVHADGNRLHVAIAGTVDKVAPQTAYYLHSDDGGMTWSTPIPINTQNMPPITSRGNDIQIAAKGQQIVVSWQTQGDFPNQGPIVDVYSSDAGNTWNAGAHPAGNTVFDQAHMDLESDDLGHFHAVWLEDPEEQGYQSVRYARSQTGGATWEKAVAVDDSTCSCCWNTLKMSTSGRLNLLYRDMEPRDMALLQSLDNGNHWQRISTVGAFNWKFDGCPHIGGGLAESATGLLHSVVWTGLDAKQGLYYLRSDDAGSHWTMPKLMSRQALHGDIAAEGQMVTAVWDQKGPEGLSIIGSHSNDDGKSWSSALPLSKPGTIASHPRVLHTQAGVVVMWTEKAPKQSSQWVVLLIE